MSQVHRTYGPPALRLSKRWAPSYIDGGERPPPLPSLSDSAVPTILPLLTPPLSTPYIYTPYSIFPRGKIKEGQYIGSILGIELLLKEGRGEGNFSPPIYSGARRTRRYNSASLEIYYTSLPYYQSYVLYSSNNKNNISRLQGNIVVARHGHPWGPLPHTTAHAHSVYNGRSAKFVSFIFYLLNTLGLAAYILIINLYIYLYIGGRLVEFI